MSFHDRLSPSQRAALDVSRNIVLRAGAGSGKTTVLAHRYLWLLEHGIPEAPGQAPTRVKVDEILTLTFTRKASEEMRQRIGDAISRQLDDPAQSEAHAGTWLEARSRLDVAPIATIHAFCHQLLEEFSLSAGIDPAFELVDDLDQQLMIEEAINATLEADDSIIGELAPWWSRQQVTDILHAIIAQQPAIAQWIHMLGELSEQAIVRHMIASSAEAIAQVRQLLAPQTTIARLSACLHAELAAFGEFSTSCPALKAMPHMREALRLASEGTDPVALGYHARNAAQACLKTDKGAEVPYVRGEKPYSYFVNGMAALDKKREGVRARVDLSYMEAAEDLPDLLKWARQIPSPGDLCLARHLFILIEIGQRAHSLFRESLARHHGMTMDDLLLKTHEMLLSKTEIRAVLQRRYRQIMVDEFQDTDGLQWEIIRLLAGGDPEGKKPLEPSRLFIVGDDKQSIYRFRGADVSVFRAAIDAVRHANRHAAAAAALPLASIPALVPPGEAAPDPDGEGILELSTNYRSRVEVLEFINDLFGSLLTGGAPDSPAYEAAPQRLDPRPDSTPGEPRVHLALYPESEATRETEPRTNNDAETSLDASGQPAVKTAKDGDASRRLHLEAVVAAMARALGMHDGSPGLLVADHATGQIRAAQPGDFMVLLRTRTPLDDLRRHLSRRGIPYVVESKSTIFDTQEVRDLRNLLEFLADPRNDIALFGVLRSPLFACDDTTLSLVALRPGGSLWERLEGLVEELHIASPSQAEAYGHHGVAALDTASRLLNQWRRLAHRLPIHDMLCAAFDQTCAWATYTPAQRVNIDRVMTLVAEMDRRGTGEIASVVRRLDEAEREARMDENLGDTEAAGQAVRILTVHASKGLEAPIVLLADLPYEGRNINDALLMLSEYDPARRAPAVAVGLSPCQDLRDAFEPTGQDFVVASHLRSELTAREVAEIKRVFYVAATRAQDHLILVAPASRATDSPKSWRNLLFAAIQNAECPAGDADAAAAWWAEVWKQGSFGPREGERGITRHLSLWAMAQAQAQPAKPEAPAREVQQHDESTAPLEQSMRRAANAPRGMVLAPMATPIDTRERAIVRLNPSEADLLERCPGCYVRRVILGIRPANTRDIHRPVRDISPAEFGSLVHRAMQENVTDLAEIRHLIRREAAGFGHYIEHPGFATTLDATARKLQRDVEHLHQQLTQSLKALCPDADLHRLGMSRETPFAMRHRRMELHGAIDLLVTFPDGSRCIVDFKTDRLKPGERADDHMRRAGYDLQLSIYAHAVRQQLPSDGRSLSRVHCMLCFTQSPEPVVFEFDDALSARLEDRMNRWEAILVQGMAGLKPAVGCAECRAWLGHAVEEAVGEVACAQERAD